MTKLKLSLAASALALSLLIAPAAQAGPTDQIRIAPKGAISPEGWALVTAFYSCAPRTGTTYLDSAVIQAVTPDGQPGTSSFDDVSGPLRCNGKTHQVNIVAGGDLEPFRFVPGPVRVEASFWNDVLGHWHEPTGFGPRITAQVVLR